MRRGHWLTAVALVLVAVTGCTPHSRATTHNPAVNPVAVPHPPLTETAALAVVQDYDKAIATALDAKSPARLEALETGSALATSLADRRFATPQRPASNRRDALAREQVYLPPVSSYPQWFVSSSPYRLDAGRIEYSVFERAKPGAPWLKSLRTTSTAHILSAPVVVGGSVEIGSHTQVAQARTAVTDLMRYLETGKDRGALTDVMLAQNDAEYFWANLGINSDWESGKVTCDPDPHALLVTMPTRDGAVDVFGSVTCTYVNEARYSSGMDLDPTSVRWGFTRVKGVPGITWDEEKQFMLSVSRDGAAKVLGYAYSTVDEALI